MSSLTKMMTMYVIFKVIDENEIDYYNEIVEISTYSSSIGGSCALLRAGDRITIIDLLYAMNLPSGKIEYI